LECCTCFYPGHIDVYVDGNPSYLHDDDGTLLGTVQSMPLILLLLRMPRLSHTKDGLAFHTFISCSYPYQRRLVV
jgi:hypothetical protein